MGYTIQRVTFGGHRSPTGTSFEESVRRGQEFVRDAIASKTPCFTWQGEQKEYYVINGYDDSGFYISGPGTSDTSVPWSRLGDSESGWVEAFSLTSCEPTSDRQTVKDALEFAIAISQNPNEWVLPDCKTGLEAYDVWTESLETKKAFWFGNSFNAVAWAECRRRAVGFLTEAKARLKDVPPETFDEAIGHYVIVSENMNKVAEAFPFGCADPNPKHIEDGARVAGAVSALRDAQKAERDGLKALERIVEFL